MSKKIFRTEKSYGSPFTQIDNRIINNFRLSDRAFRLLTYCLSQKDDWKFDYQRVSNATGKSISYLKRAMKELKLKGFAETHRKVINSKTVRCDFYFFEDSEQEFSKGSNLTLH